MPEAKPGRLQYLTKLRCTPRLLCTPAQVRQIKTPYGTDDQVGFLAGQSKQTCVRLRCVMRSRHQLLKANTKSFAVWCHLQLSAFSYFSSFVIPFSLGSWRLCVSIGLISGLPKPSIVQGMHLCMHDEKRNEWKRASAQAH